MTHYIIKLVQSNVLKDYAGMNPHAAKALGFNHIHKNEILVDKHLSCKRRKSIIYHEEVEDKLMGRGMSYWKAHNIALKAQKKRFGC